MYVDYILQAHMYNVHMYYISCPCRMMAATNAKCATDIAAAAAAAAHRHTDNNCQANLERAAENY